VSAVPAVPVTPAGAPALAPPAPGDDPPPASPAQLVIKRVANRDSATTTGARWNKRWDIRGASVLSR
jgi:hypothetical protein